MSQRDHERETPDEEDARIRNTLIGFVIVLLLLGAGYWLVDEMNKSARLQSCLEQGRRNCGASTFISGTTRR
jgi:heme/copper-type cytochrome/quinol oxidase subunit 4